MTPAPGAAPTSPRPSADLAPVVGRAFRAAIVAVVVVALTAAAALAVTLRWQDEAFRQREVARLARQAQVLTMDRETGLRGYVATGRDALLGPERAARAGVWATFDTLEALVHDPGQRRRAAALRGRVARWDSLFAAPVLASAAAGRAPDAFRRAPLLDAPLFDPVRAGFAEFLRVGDERYARSRRRVQALAATSGLLVVGSLATLGLTLLRLRGGLLAQAGALDEQQRQLEEQAVELEAQTAELETLNAELHETNERLLGAVTETTRVNEELEAFSYTLAHDLRAPLRGLDGYSYMLEQDYAERLDDRGREHLARLRAGSRRMARLIDDLLALARVGRAGVRRERVDLGALARAALEELRRAEPARRVEARVADGMVVRGDPTLLGALVQNLVGNAWKFSANNAAARIEVGIATNGREPAYFVRDDGAGFDMAYADRLFGAFQRLHGQEFEGTGIGLAIVHRVALRHGGRVWAESAPGRGATFFFTIPSAGSTAR